jgi:hypothetical protein
MVLYGKDAAGRRCTAKHVHWQTKCKGSKGQYACQAHAHKEGERKIRRMMMNKGDVKMQKKKKKKKKKRNIRVMCKVRRLIMGGENGQFRHNRASNA